MLTRKKRRLNQEDDTKILRDILSPDEIKVFDPVTLNNLKDVIRTLTDREPNIVEIVNSDIDICHKANLVELCEIYKNLDPLTEDSLRIKNLINKRFTDYSNEAQELKSLPTHLKQKYTEFKTTGSSNLLVKILTLKTSPENTKTLIRKYQELRTTSGEEYNKLKKWVNYALDLPYDILSSSPKLNVGVLEKVAVYMENHIYGLKSVKEQILLFLKHFI
jgi:ATP-dependent Lon protease